MLILILSKRQKLRSARDVNMVNKEQNILLLCDRNCQNSNQLGIAGHETPRSATESVENVGIHVFIQIEGESFPVD